MRISILVFGNDEKVIMKLVINAWKQWLKKKLNPFGRWNVYFCLFFLSLRKFVNVLVHTKYRKLLNFFSQNLKQTKQGLNVIVFHEKTNNWIIFLSLHCPICSSISTLIFTSSSFFWFDEKKNFFWFSSWVCLNFGLNLV